MRKGIRRPLSRAGTLRLSDEHQTSESAPGVRAGATTPIDEYDRSMEPSRALSTFIRPLPLCSAIRLNEFALEACLINLNALGVGMTEPVEQWIRRAGKRGGELGLPDLAKALDGHARQEADHHLPMQEDLRRLIDRSNQTHLPTLRAGELLALASMRGVGVPAGSACKLLI